MPGVVVGGGVLTKIIIIILSGDWGMAQWLKRMRKLEAPRVQIPRTPIKRQVDNLPASPACEVRDGIRTASWPMDTIWVRLSVLPH